MNEALGELTALLAPLTVEEFFAQNWNRKSIHISGHSRKFQGLFDRAAFDRGVHRCADLKVGYTDEKGWPAHHNIKPEQIGEMLASGKTVCASVIDTADPVLTAFLTLFQKHFALAGKFFFNSYLSPDGSGFGLHLDHHPVFILQMDGQKRWRFSPEPALRAVLTNISFPRDREVLKLPWTTVTRPRDADLCEVVLNPGDVLYLPKGTWHSAQAIGGSLALTLAMETVPSLALIQQAIASRLNTLALRDFLPGYGLPSIQDGMPAELESLFESGLNDLRKIVNEVGPSDLYRVWREMQPGRRPGS